MITLFPGLTIETVSCTNLIICIGLCVDSAAHIAHQFLAEKGKTLRQKMIRGRPFMTSRKFGTFFDTASPIVTLFITEALLLLSRNP
jgi:hypothetical protein